MPVEIKTSSLVIRLDAIKEVYNIRLFEIPLQYDEFIGVINSMDSHYIKYLDEIGLIGLTTDDNGDEYFKDYCIISYENIQATLQICPWLTLGNKDNIVYMTGTRSKYLNVKQNNDKNSFKYFKIYLKEALIKALDNSGYSLEIGEFTNCVFKLNNKTYNHKELLIELLKDNLFPYFLIIDIYDYKLGIVYFQITISPTKSNSFENCYITVQETKTVHLICETYENYNLIKSPCSGIIKFVENDVVKESDNNNTVISNNSKIIVIDDKIKNKHIFHLAYGAQIKVNNGSRIKKGDLLASWDPYSLPIISKKGIVQYQDIIEEISISTIDDKTTGILAKTIIPIKQSKGRPKLIPRIRIKDINEETNDLLSEIESIYFLPVHTILNVENEDKVKVGTILARMPKPHYWGGHPKSFSIAYKFISGKFKEKFIYSHDMKNLISEYKGNEIGFNKVFLYKTSYKNDTYKYKHDECLDGLYEVRQKTVYFE